MRMSPHVRNIKFYRGSFTNHSGALLQAFSKQTALVEPLKLINLAFSFQLLNHIMYFFQIFHIRYHIILLHLIPNSIRLSHKWKK